MPRAKLRYHRIIPNLPFDYSIPGFLNEHSIADQMTDSDDDRQIEKVQKAVESEDVPKQIGGYID